MKKRLQFIISLILVFMISLSALVMPASSFTNDVVTSTEDMLLVNLDTHTTVFSRKPDNMWYCGYLTELMTFLIAEEELSDPTAVSVTIEQDFIDALPYSDGCLNKFVGEKLTAQDLMGIMLMTTGSDAAYALADLVTDGDRDTFVKMMNDKAVALGMTKTNYLEPGYSDNKSHHTTCRDLMRLYLEVDKSEFYNRVMEDKSYTPAGLKEKKYTVNSQASILNDDSPYYFRYCNDAKHSYTNETGAGIVLTTTYHGQTYFFAGLLGLNTSEKNVYSDAKKLTSWAYLNLSDRKVLDTENTMTKIKVDTGWGTYEEELVSLSSAAKTLPNDFDELLLSYKVETPKSVKWPMFEGQGLGTATVTYDNEEIDQVDLVVTSDEGVDLLSDTARFGRYVLHQLLPQDSVEKTTAESETEG